MAVLSTHVASEDLSSEKITSEKGREEVLPSQDGRVTLSTPTRTTIARRFLACTAAIYYLFLFTQEIYSDRGLPSTPIRVESLHPKFLHQCHQLLRPTAQTHTSRLSSLSAVLSQTTHIESEGPPVWIGEPGPSAFYYTGAFSSADWHLSERPFLIAISPSSASKSNTSSSADISTDIIFLTPEFEKLRAQLIPLPKQLKGRVKWVSWKEHESPFVVLSQALGRPSAVVVDGGVRELVAAGLRIHLGENAVKAGEGLKTTVGLIRERKDEREIGLLRCANQMTLHAIRKTRSRMRFGITESRTGEILREEMKKVGLTNGDGLVLFGENAALPHGSGTDRKLCKTDLILIDAGGKWGGYVADITRTFALPKSHISNHHLRIWETVRRAQYAPYALILKSNHTSTSPLTFGDLDRSARTIISKAHSPHSVISNDKGVQEGPDYSVFTHRLGHGIGLEGHESPYVVQGPQGEAVVQPGHVFSLEPGVYLPKVDGEGEGVGIRLEDCFVVTEGKDGKLSGKWLSGPVRSWGEI